VCVIPTDCVTSLCDLETSRMRRPCPALGRSATAKKKVCVITVDKSTRTGHVAGMRGARLGKQF